LRYEDKGSQSKLHCTGLRGTRTQHSERYKFHDSPRSSCRTNGFYSKIQTCVTANVIFHDKKRKMSVVFYFVFINNNDDNDSTVVSFFYIY